ncbi:hypothetical protein [Hyphomonas sp.]|uniref:hypothetical protein n=1 Tax=Hyphomonas sp. TaxID=87 RepID=UPI0025B9D063|nr:hypothetical protein [Hyphomonas sp.]
MTPEAAKAALRRQLEPHGITVTITRGGSQETSGLAKVTRVKGDELVNDIEQTSHEIVLLNEDLAFAPARDDIVEFGEHMLAIEEVDNQTRAIAGVVVGYNITAKGR